MSWRSSGLSGSEALQVVLRPGALCLRQRLGGFADADVLLLSLLLQPLVLAGGDRLAREDRGVEVELGQVQIPQPQGREPGDAQLQLFHLLADMQDQGTGEVLREKRRLQLQEKLALCPAWQDSGLVFTRENGEPTDPSSLSALLHRITAKAGLPSIRVHDLRHNAATLHLARGENPKVVQELLGHSTIALTMDTYSHVTPSIHAAVAKKMQALFAEG
ncbi:MAG: tyrosine-type recombinase/integrase [Dehalococcoidia bacterium]|nr:tyrosine-type recombinase/integrase [Dehalococcoidia bacterium]